MVLEIIILLAFAILVYLVAGHLFAWVHRVTLSCDCGFVVARDVIVVSELNRRRLVRLLRNECPVCSRFPPAKSAEGPCS